MAWFSSRPAPQPDPVPQHCQSCERDLTLVPYFRLSGGLYCALCAEQCPHCKGYLHMVCTVCFGKGYIPIDFAERARETIRDEWERIQAVRALDKEIEDLKAQSRRDHLWQTTEMLLTKIAQKKKALREIEALDGESPHE